jgi:hypothetical protein
VAEVSGDCRGLQIRVDGWVFGDQRPFDGPVGAPVGDDPAADPPSTTAPTQDLEDGLIPIAWRGAQVRGHLEIDRTCPSVVGRFVADDGAEVAVTGGRDGEYVFQLSCAIWPENSIQDRYEELAAGQPLPPLVGPSTAAPSGYSYAGLEVTGTGEDRSISYRMIRPASSSAGGVEQCIDEGADRPTCGPVPDRPSSTVRVCVTTADGCTATSGETRTEVPVDPAIASTG